MTFLPDQEHMRLGFIRGESTAGVKAGIAESAVAGWQSSSKLMASRGDAALYSDLYNENLDKITEITGEEFTRFNNLPMFRDQIDQFEDGQDYIAKGRFGRAREKGLKDFLDEQNTQIQKLKETNPDILSPQEVWENTKRKASVMERDVESVRERNGFWGGAVGFGAEMAGSFTTADPINQATLFVGGLGKNLATKVATEFGFNAVAEGINQFVGVPESRENLGLEQLTTGQKATATVAAGAGAAAIKGAVHTAPRAYKAAEARLAPQRSFARQIKDAVEISTGETPPGFKPSGLTDEDYLFYLRTAAPDTASTRAAAHALEIDINERKARVDEFGDNPDASPILKDMVDEAAVFYETGTSKAELLSSTAGRVEDGDGFTIDPDALSLEVQKMHMDRAKAADPELFASIDKNQAAVSRLEAEIKGIEAEIEGLSIGDGVRAIDEASGDRVKVIEADLKKKNLSKKKRADLEAELDTIVESLGEDAVVKGAQDARIGPRKRFAQKKNALANAKKKLRKDNRSMTRAIDNIVTGDKVARTLMSEGSAPARFKNPLETVDAPPIEEVISTGERVFQDVKAKTDDGDVIKIGDKDIDPNMEIPTGALDESGNPVIMTAKEFLEEIEEDDLMLEAMKVCGL